MWSVNLCSTDKSIVFGLVRFNQVAGILKKPERERTQEECALLEGHRDTVQELSKRQARRNLLKLKQEEVSRPDLNVGCVSIAENLFHLVLI